MAAAIAFSAILIVSAWIIERRQAWRKAGRLALIICGGVVAIGLAGWAWFAISDSLEKSNRAREQAAILAQFREHGIDSFLGARLGMSEPEVTYVLGPPARRIPVPSSPDTFYLLWSESYAEKMKQAAFSSGAAYAIGCGGKHSWDCPDLLGIKLGDSEGAVTTRLGPPSSSSLLDNGKQKEMTYGPPSGGIRLLVDAAGRGVSFMEVRKAGYIVEEDWGPPVSGEKAEPQRKP